MDLSSPWVKPSAVAIAAVGLLLVTLRRRQRKVKGAPYVEKQHWLLGILPELLPAVANKDNHGLFYRFHKKYGKTYVMELPFQPSVIDTTDPKNVEYILKTNFDNYIKGSWFRDRLTDLLGDGIFNVDGAMWHSQRKIASHMFTKNQFTNHIWHVIAKNCAKVVELLRETPRGQVVDVFNLMNRFTLDSIGEIGFARDIGSLAKADSPFLLSFDRAQQISVQRFWLPLWRLNRFFRTGTEHDATYHFKMLSDYSYETVRMLRDDPSGEKGNSFVGMFIVDSKKTGANYNDTYLRDMVLNFLIAGRDTTAQALSWTFYLLALHPEVEKKMLEEIKEVLGDGPITYDNSAKLKYVQNVVNEGLRLYPSVPADTKMAVNDDTLPDGTWLPHGTVIQYNPYSMGRDTDLWGEDAEAFKPERWEGKEMPSAFVYTAFNAGPRECLGKRLAWVEMRTCLAEIVRNVHLELAVPAESIKQDVQLTIGMSSGLPCRVVPR